jgi:ubiquinol-cytochrome c reductase iron-sulfur subunit
MRRLGRLLLWVWLVAIGRARRARREREEASEAEPIVAPTSPDRRAENAVLALLGLTALAAIAFVAIYALDDGSSDRTQLYGLTLGLSLAFLATALIMLGRHLVAAEELEEEYPGPEHPEAQQDVSQIVHESGSGLTRKRLLLTAGGAAGGALGLAALSPVLSLGPWLNTDSLYDTPWRADRRLVDEHGVPLRARDIERQTFYTAYPEDARRDAIGAPIVLVRLDPATLRLPAERARWAPDGIVAYSKICTHAGCAISLYRTPLFAPTAPKPALVCPCHYSTFDPADGGSVLFGPAGRALPQLPLRVDARGELRAAGNFSGPVGPSWQGVRGERPT